MDHFFASIASLLSNLLRSCVENSVLDLVTLLEEYSAGNEYTGDYDIFEGLALPELIHPVILFLVSCLWSWVPLYPTACTACSMLFPCEIAVLYMGFC